MGGAVISWLVLLTRLRGVVVIGSVMLGFGIWLGVMLAIADICDFQLCPHSILLQRM